MTDHYRDSECTYPIKKYATRVLVAWEMLDYGEDDWRPDHQANTHYNPTTDTTIRGEDMPWELVPEEPYYDVTNYITSNRFVLAEMTDGFLGERSICD